MAEARRSRRRLAIAAMSLALAGCRSPARPAPPAAGMLHLTTVAPIEHTEALEWGRHVHIGADHRPVLSASRTIELPTRWVRTDAATGFQVHAIVLPDAFRSVETLFIDPAVQDAPRVGPFGWELPASRSLGIRLLWPHQDGPTPEIVAPTAAGPDGPARLVVRGWIALPLAARDARCPPVPVPADGVLTYAVGIAPGAWFQGSPPLDFGVAAVVDGREEPLRTTRVDPADVATHRAWIDVEVPLDAFAGRAVAFRFTARKVGTAGAATSLPLFADPTIRPRRTQATRPNVLLVSLDTLRAKSVGTFGAARATMPETERRLGERGTTFAHAMAPAPHTLPSHLSLLTGLHPQTLRRAGTPLAVPATAVTLAGALRAVGYRTAAVTENGFLLPEAGFLRGFERYVEHKTREQHAPVGMAARTFQAAYAWLRATRPAPFFLFVHTYQAHEPYQPPAAYAAWPLDPAELPTRRERLLLRYEQEMRYVDDELAAFLDAVAALGHDEDTLVVVTSDHGEEFGEHGNLVHGLHAYVETLHVPLWLRFPGVVPAGHRVETLVSLMDVTPTILDLLGVAAPRDADGQSLVPLFAPSAGRYVERPVRAEAFIFAQPALVLGVRTRHHSCVFRPLPSDPECFDLADDPYEERRLPLDEHAAWGRSMRAEERAWRAGDADGGVGPAAPRLPDDDAERLEKLRELGYVG